MISIGEQRFHVLMGALVLGSLFLDSIMRSLLPAWNPPQIGLVTFVLGLVWLGLFVAHRMRNAGEQLRVLLDRLDRAERKVDGLERELALRNPPLPGMGRER
jgi:hypothetical protein